MRIFHKIAEDVSHLGIPRIYPWGGCQCKKCKAIKTKKIESLDLDGEIRRARKNYPTLTELVDMAIRYHAENKS